MKLRQKLDLGGVSKLLTLLIASLMFGLTIALVVMQFWSGRNPETAEIQLTPTKGSDEPIQPISNIAGLDRNKIELGRKLFHDPRLSHDDTVSCASCHNLALGGTDRRARSIGVNGAEGVINSPTVLNSGFNFSQFWDGRAASLELQTDEPIQSQREMASSWPEVVAKLKNSSEYVGMFRQVYKDEIKASYIKISLGAFERSLSTPNSRFDRYLQHPGQYLSEKEVQGYQLFKSFGCASCHQGINVGGNMYQKLGVMAPYFSDRGGLTRADRGRFNVTGDPNDMYMFKVPSLRNVALTAPYFHDGNAATLPDAVRLMAKYQLGRRLSETEVHLIVEFLNTLTGELNGNPL